MSLIIAAILLALSLTTSTSASSHATATRGTTLVFHSSEVSLAEMQRQWRRALEQAQQQPISVQLPPRRLQLPRGGLQLDARDTGVLLRGAGDGSTVFDGGLTISGWTRLNNSSSIWSAPAPAALRDPTDPTGFQHLRQLYLHGIRLRRTRTSAADLGFDSASGATITGEGYLSPWPTAHTAFVDPYSVEAVTDATFSQTRCLVQNISVATANFAPSCSWSPQIPGGSPGSSITQLNTTSYEDCQQACCALGASTCKAIVFHPNPGVCYLLPRPYGPNFKPENNSFVADMDPTPPPPPGNGTLLTMIQPCFQLQRGDSQTRNLLPTYFDNTGNFSAVGAGSWFFDRLHGRLLMWPPAGVASPFDVVVAVNQTLLTVGLGASNVGFQQLTFQHATWLQTTTPVGFVERYGGVYFAPPNGTYARSAAAVEVASAESVVFSNCTFQQLGLWAVNIGGGSHNVTIERCLFSDLGSGGVQLGDVNDTAETLPARQNTNFHVCDSIFDGMSRDFPGAPGIHSFCTVNMTIEHNTVRDVGYTGISFNWPHPQGPTLGPDGNSPAVGYSANNVIASNDVSQFMSYFLDGGGIHTIGRSRNSSIRGNYFHNLASGAPGMHSVEAQSVVYIDNWSCDINITDTVVDACNSTKQGPYFFQGSGLGLAHDTYLTGLYLRDAGTPGGGGRGAPCNCSQVEVTPPGQPFGPAAEEIIGQAGPRP